ncbi:MAG TPA: hypothetical protein VND66_06545 [Acidobacteriaceae bacterium]|nr:hypothetical protein [Acidobacteriaceae bacterium]
MTLMKGMFTILCIGCVSTGVGLGQSTPTAPVTLTIATTPVAAPHGYAIPSDFSGLSFERGTLNTNNAGASGYLFSPTNTQLVTLFQNIGIKSLRVGGGSVDDEVPVGFNPDGFLGIDSLFDFAQAAGTKVIYTMRLLNTHNAYPNLKTMDAAVASHIWQRNSSLLENFALGNEPDFHSYHTYCTKTGCTCTYPAGCTGTSTNLHIEDPAIYETLTIGNTTAGTAYPSYVADWQNFANTILGSVPAATFSAPDTGAYSTLTYTPSSASGVSWTQQFAEDEKSAKNGEGAPLLVDATQHYYVGGGPGTTTAQQAIDNMLSTAWVNNTAIATQPSGAGDGKTTTYAPYLWLYDNNMAPVAANGVPYRLTESNDYLTGIKGASNGYAAALWALDYMHWWAEHNAAGVNFHNKQWIPTDTIVPSPNPCVGACGNYQTAPKGYGIKAFDLSGHGYVEPVTISNPNGINVTSYAVGDAQDLYVTIINKTHSTTNDSTDAAVLIQPNGFAAASCASMVLTDGDPGNALSYNATLGGAVIANNARWAGTWTPLAPTDNGSCAVTVQPTTAAVVKVHAASNYVGPIQINQNGALEIFGIGIHHDSWYDSQIPVDVPNSALNNWNGWVNQQGGVKSTGGSAVVKNLNNTLEVFIPSTTGDVYYSYQLTPGGTWSPWTDMGSTSAGVTDLQAANNADGSLSVFGIGTNGDVWYASQNAPGVGWSDWTDLSGEQIQPGFVVGQNLSGLLDVLGVDASGNVWDNRQVPTGEWNGWNSLGGETFNSHLAIARNLDGRLELFAVDSNFNVWQNSQTVSGGSWSGWSEIPGNQLKPGFVVGQNKDGRLVLIGVQARAQDALSSAGVAGQSGYGQDVWSVSQQTPGGTFAANWTDLGGANIDPKLVVGNTADGRIQLFGTGSNQDVWSDWQLNSAGAWSGWTDFGGKGIQF